MQCVSITCLTDPLGHHAVTYIFGGDVVSRHNQLRDISVQMCQFASVRASIEAGSRLSHKYLHTRPTDAIRQLGLLQTCSPQLHCGFSAWFGSTHMVEVGTTAGSAALSTEIRKHENNDQKCMSLAGYVSQ